MKLILIEKYLLLAIFLEKELSIKTIGKFYYKISFIKNIYGIV